MCRFWVSFSISRDVMSCAIIFVFSSWSAFSERRPSIRASSCFICSLESLSWSNELCFWCGWIPFGTTGFYYIIYWLEIPEFFLELLFSGCTRPPPTFWLLRTGCCGREARSICALLRPYIELLWMWFWLKLAIPLTPLKLAFIFSLESFTIRWLSFSPRLFGLIAFGPN